MGILFNKGQRRVIEAGVFHLKHSSQQVFEFKGEAGTGKSVVIQEIVKRSGLNFYRIAPCAFTGSASLVMRMKGFPTARTCHSWLYEPVLTPKLDSDGNVIINPYFGTPETYISFIPKDLTNIDAFIVDEAYFSTEEIRREMESRGKPIIATGDPNQLPPVDGNPGFLVDPDIMALDEVVRQAQNSGIIYIAHRVSRGLPVYTGFYNDALVIDSWDLEANPDLYRQLVLSSNMVICAKNNTRDMINKQVREEFLGINSILPVYGEQMICRKNNYLIENQGINLANGLIGRISRPPEVNTFDGKKFNIDFTPNLFNASFSNIDVDYNYYIADHNQKQSIKNSGYRSGELFEFAYAITSHISQGSQAPNVMFLDEWFFPDVINKVRYTAVTRASNRLIYIIQHKKYY